MIVKRLLIALILLMVVQVVASAYQYDCSWDKYDGLWYCTEYYPSGWFYYHCAVPDSNEVCPRRTPYAAEVYWWGSLRLA